MTLRSSPSPTQIANESPMPQRGGGGGGGRGRFPRGGGRGRGGRDGRGGSTSKGYHSLDHTDRTRERYRSNYIDAAPGKRWSCDQTSAVDGVRTSKWVRLLCCAGGVDLWYQIKVFFCCRPCVMRSRRGLWWWFDFLAMCVWVVRKLAAIFSFFWQMLEELYVCILEHRVTQLRVNVCAIVCCLSTTTKKMIFDWEPQLGDWSTRKMLKYEVNAIAVCLMKTCRWFCYKWPPRADGSIWPIWQGSQFLCQVCEGFCFLSLFFHLPV